MTGAAAGKAGTEERTDPTDGRAGKRTGTGVIAENGNQRAIGDHPGKDSGPNLKLSDRGWRGKGWKNREDVPRQSLFAGARG